MNTQRTHALVRSLASLLLLSLIPGPNCLGKTKERGKPLPPEVLKAKSVFLDTTLRMLDTPFLVRQHVQQWGRFRIAERPEKADLILTIEGIGSTTVVLTVRDPSSHKVYWMTSAQYGTIPGRCIQLIDLFRRKIEADETAQAPAAPTAPQP